METRVTVSCSVFRRVQLLLVLTAGLALGCAHARQLSPVASRQVIRGQLVLSSDIDLEQERTLVDSLLALRGEMAERLGLANSPEPIFVYLFAEPGEFQKHTRRWYPALRGRRAYFVESAAGLNVFVIWSARIGEDLRHELAHGYLHSATVGVPLWLDEGIAEYFELPADGVGLHWEHIEYLASLRRAGWSPDLPRLEALEDAAAMTRRDYAEAWLWVHFCLHTRTDRAGVLRDYLAEPADVRKRASFADRLGAASGDVVDYLRLLAGASS